MHHCHIETLAALRIDLSHDGTLVARCANCHFNRLATPCVVLIMMPDLCTQHLTQSGVQFLALMVSDNTNVQKHLRAPLVSYRECFNLFDEDQDDTVTPDEFIQALLTFGMSNDPQTEAEVDQLSETLIWLSHPHSFILPLSLTLNLLSLVIVVQLNILPALCAYSFVCGGHDLSGSSDSHLLISCVN